jgi:outer membrane receptor protein involved in Fe transport
MNSRLARLAVFTLLALVLSPVGVRAQGGGRIVGRVVDAATGRGISGAQVSVPGTSLRTLSGVDGRYNLTGVPSGAQTVSVMHLGHAPKTVTGVQVTEAATLDISLSQATLAIGGITVTANRERGSVNRALDEQRTAIGVTNSTTSEQIARSPDSDAAQAVQRVSGVTVQDGKYVFVRGLGERYTTASLNGARIPSPEPEKRVVPLDMFPSSLLEAITTSKTFTPDQPGDFSGAQVNLRTRSFPARRTVTGAIGTGYSPGQGGAMLFVPGAGGDWLGTASAQRDLPLRLRQAGNLNGLTQGDVNVLARSFRNEWSPREGDLSPNLSGNLSVGGEDPVLGQRIGYIASATYSRSQDVRTDEERTRVAAGDQGQPLAQDVFRGSTGSTGITWGGMLNLSTLIGGANHRIELNNSYNRTSDYEAREAVGSFEEFSNVQHVQSLSLQFVERSVRSNQLRGTHMLGRARIDWQGSNSRVVRSEPDRSDLLYGQEEDITTGQLLAPAWLGFLAGGARRTFSALDEDSYNGDLALSVNVGPSGSEGRIKLGGAYRHTQRDYESQSYDLRSLNLTHGERALSPEEVFDGRYAQGADGRLTVSRNLFGGTYMATDNVAAGFAMAEWTFGDRLQVVGGARVERWELELTDRPADGSRRVTGRANTDVNPALALNYRMSDAVTMRLSATQTLARPEYRELSLSQRVTDPTARQIEFGNPELERTRVQNYDARWEWYPASGEVLSLGFFAKRFQDPIERIEVAATGASQFSFANAESAVNYGVELEVRKQLGSLSPALEPFTVTLNATVMHSRIRLGEDALSAATSDERPMVGQAPYVLNAGLAYATDGGRTSATLLYNIVGKRISAAATQPITVNSYEMPRNMLDFSLRLPLHGRFSGKVDAENLLDAPVEIRQGDVVRLRYRTGRSVGLGVTWRP